MTLTAIVLFAVLHAAPQTNWKLVWSDEFNAPAHAPPDASKWGYDLGATGWGNSELETYTDTIENAEHDGKGNLVIHVLHPSAGKYTSARLKTQTKFNFTYGKIEARMRLPYSQG